MSPKFITLFYGYLWLRYGKKLLNAQSYVLFLN
jgi:hypothetical protein